MERSVLDASAGTTVKVPQLRKKCRTQFCFLMPFSKFPTSGVASSLYYANDTQALYLCCGGSNYFPLAGLLPSGMTLQQDSNASSICGYPIENSTIAPADGMVLQFDFASKTWKQVPLPSSGITAQEALVQSISMSIALG
jgi:hypothetical protein